MPAIQHNTGGRKQLRGNDENGSCRGFTRTDKKKLRTPILSSAAFCFIDPGLMENSGSNFVDCTLKLGLPDTSASKSDPRPATKKMRTEILQGSPSEEIKQTTEVKQCTFCGTTVTPCWRTGPEGKKTLCNKCGLKFQRKKMLY